MESNNKKRKGFDIKLLAMDAARIVCAPLIPILRIKKITPEGEKYTKKLVGGAIIAANHTSFLDPFIVGVTFWRRRLFFLVAEVVMQGWLRSLLLKGIGAIKINRETTDIEAIKKSVSVLKGGSPLVVFPQGGIDKSNDVESIKSGAVLLALQANVEIVPMYIQPREKWYKCRRVVIGNNINPREFCTKKIPSTMDINNITEELAKEMQRCKGDKE